MEEIQFKFNNCDTEMDKLNALMQWMTNRAWQFDKSKYNRVCFRLEDTAESCVALEMCFILSTYSDIEFYVPRKDARKCRCYIKNSIIKPVSIRKWNKMTTELDTMFWDVQSTTTRYENMEYAAMIYCGISSETIKRIAENFYGWNDDRKAYIKHLKQVVKEARKAIKAEEKALKKQLKEMHNYASSDDQR